MPGERRWGQQRRTAKVETSATNGKRPSSYIRLFSGVWTPAATPLSRRPRPSSRRYRATQRPAGGRLRLLLGGDADGRGAAPAHREAALLAVMLLHRRELDA